MADTPITIGQLADEVRSKNAGPFWMTLDIFLRTSEDYDWLIASKTVNPDSIGRLYDVAPEHVQIFEIPTLNVIKISFPRAVTAGSFADRDQHAGQQHVPLASAIVATERDTAHIQAASHRGLEAKTHLRVVDASTGCQGT
ncbi:MAG: DUF4387 domain-containing protein [Solirubrobacteraceae bacterium]